MQAQLIKMLQAKQLDPKVCQAVNSSTSRMGELLSSSKLAIAKQTSEDNLPTVGQGKLYLELKLASLQDEMQLLEQRQNVLKLSKLSEETSKKRHKSLSIKKLMQERKERQQREEDRKKLESRQEEQLKSMAQQEGKQRDRILKQAKKLKIQQNLKKIKQREQERKNMLEQGQREYKANYTKQALYVRLQKQFEENVVKAREKEREQRLYQIHKLFKMTVPLEEIRNHQQKYEQLLQLHQQQRQRERARQQGQKYQPPEGSKRVRQILLQEERKVRQLQVQKLKQYQQIKGRQQKFIKQLKSHCVLKPVYSKPQSQPDRRKALSLQQIRQNGRQNLLIARRLADRSRKEQIVVMPQSAKRLDYPDYIKRAQNQSKLFSKRINEIDRIADKESDDPQLKMIKLRMEADRLCAQVESKSKLLKIKESPAIREEITELLLRSIRAKTNMLRVAADAGVSPIQ